VTGQKYNLTSRAVLPQSKNKQEENSYFYLRIDEYPRGVYLTLSIT
jgi:hypothetical protein